MTNSIVPSPPTGYASPGAAASPGAMAYFSPDSLLAYCQSQLDGLDSDITTQMNAQNKALQEREAIEGAQTVLESYGTDGPTDVKSFQKCYDALTNAASQLPAGDPVATQILAYRDKTIGPNSEFNFTPGRALTSDEQAQLDADQTAVQNDSFANEVYGGQIANYQSIQTGTLRSKPTDDQWKGVTDGLDSMTSDIKDGAEIQMLKLQDLVSQRQQAVEACNGMVTKTDQTLEDESKAVGQG